MALAWITLVVISLFLLYLLAAIFLIKNFPYPQHILFFKKKNNVLTRFHFYSTILFTTVTTF